METIDRFHYSSSRETLQSTRVVPLVRLALAPFKIKCQVRILFDALKLFTNSVVGGGSVVS